MAGDLLGRRPRASYLAVGVMALPFLLHTGSPTRPDPASGHSAYTVVAVAAPDGTGEACTTDAPCSLTTAQQVARREASLHDGGIEVLLEGGTYHLSHTFRLGPADSGKSPAQSGYDVIYQAAAGQHPVLSGGKQITGWARDPGSKDIWSVAIPKGFDARQLYIDGHRVPMAQATLGGVGMVQTGYGYLANSGAQIDAWRNPSNVHAVFKGGNGPWTETSCPITEISGKEMRLAQPCWNNLHLKALGVQEVAWFDDPMGGFGGLAPWKAPTFFTNLYSALSPGHWVIDRVADRIYYMPRKGEDLAREDVEVPVLQTLLQIGGTLEHPAHDIAVRGLTFEYGTWTAPDRHDGFPQMQADWYLTGKDANTREGTCRYNKPHGSCPFASWTRTPANVVLTHTARVEMVGDRFVHLGGAGIDLYDGARDDLVEGNEFTDVAASAVQLGATDDPLPEAAYGGMRERHDTVTDNYIHEVANQYPGGIGIWLGYTSYSEITHNYIEHVPYTGISIGWGGWHQTVLAPNRNPNGNAHNVVANNLLYDYMHVLGDGGAVYSNGSQATSWGTALEIRHNVAYRGTNTDFSLYTDAASRYVKIGGNFVYWQPWDSFNTGGCHTVGHIRIFNNYFSQGGPAYPCFAYTDIVKEKNYSVCQDPMPSEAPVSVMRDAGLEPAWRSLIDQYRPEVDLVGPAQIGTAGGKVLISGGGFTPESVVRFGKYVAKSVTFVSGDYLFAKAPAESGTVPVTVTNAHGTSTKNVYSQLTYTGSPEPCQASMGSGTTTSLLS